MKISSIKSFIVSPIGYLVMAALVLWLVGLFAARQNNLTMIQLRNDVIEVDKANGDVEASLVALREHVYGHMNTDLTSGSNPIKPPIQLKGRYDRLMAEEAVRVKAENEKVAARGESICGSKFPAGGFNAPRVACVQEYVSANAVKESAVAESLYKFDFVSPFWTPDVAGLSLLSALVLSIASIAMIGFKLIKKSLLF